MNRKPTGQLIAYGTATGTAYGVRIRYRGKRRFMTLGNEGDGWTEAMALEEMERIVAEARAGTWQPVEEEGTLNYLIKQTLESSEERDPHVLADVVLAAATEQMVKDELWNLIADRVRELVRRERKYAVRNGRAATLRMRLALEEGWKFLGECSVADVEWLAEDYGRRADEHAAQAARMRDLASAMRTNGAALVSELADEVRDGALQGFRTITKEARARAAA